MTGFGNERRNPISTLVFMDLEATGLPSFVGKRNVHITEMSFIAIDRESFETDSSQRVINKLSLCVRPRSAISHGAMEVTGLYNDVLENQVKFDDSIPKLLEYFFRRLHTPICLLAHNGKKYDFPLLQAELKNINYALDCKILCADTLEAMRYIVLNPSFETKELSPSKSTIEKPQDIIEKDNDPEVEILLTQDIDLFKNMDEPSDDNVTNAQTVTTPDFIKKTYHTPTNPVQSNTPFTTNFHKRLKLDSDSPLKTPNIEGRSNNASSSLVRRNLFAVTSTKTASGTPSKPQFSLDKLYFRFFGESPKQSHYAEADCIALSKVCQKVGSEFLKWIDNNSQPFSETTAMW